MGCGGEDVKLAPVSGVVKDKDGNPVKNAVVKFTPTDKKAEIAPTSSGTTDEEGRFTLQTADNKPGAMIGENKISITLIEGDEEDDSGESLQNLIPPQYNSESNILKTVPAEGIEGLELTVEVLQPGKKKERR
ncbi:MAG: hypothetical protein Tsb009_17470 [Planctomycetaceae bacterium]